MQTERHVIRRDGGRLIIEPVIKRGLLALLADWEATDDSLAKIDDPSVTPEDIFLNDRIQLPA